MALSKPPHFRSFYTLLQCFHHLSLMLQQSQGQVTRAFSKKQQHLDDFIKPACSGPLIKQKISKINQNWVQNVTKHLVEHYESSIQNLLAHISSLGLSDSDIANSVALVIQQAKSHFGKKLQASTIQKFKTSTLPNSPIPNSNSQSKPQTCEVKGHKHPLSNFFPCNISYRGMRFPSLEHIYQYHKARYHDCQHLANRILRAPHAGVAKRLASEIPSLSPFWHKSKNGIMRQLLQVKFNSCKLFRDTLMGLPEGCHIVHPVPDSHWGVNRHGQGSNFFGRLLMDLKRANSPTNNPKPSRSSPPSSNNTPPSVSTSNRFQLLDTLSNPPCLSSSDDWPPLSRSSPDNRLSATPKRRPRSPSSPELSPSSLPKGKRTRFVSPKNSPNTTFHVSPSTIRGPKTLWALPKLTSSTVILGSSNLSRITKSPVSDIQVVSYPGALFNHLRMMFTACKKSFDAPKNLILSVGLNNRSSKPSVTSIPELRNMLSSAFRIFPHSKILIPKINYSDNLPSVEKRNLDMINRALDDMSSRFSNLTVVKQLDPIKFSTHTDNIHWTEQTANEMLKFWLSHLN